MYRQWGSKYGGLVRASDIERHPIVAKRIARSAESSEHKRATEDNAKSVSTVSRGGSKRGIGKGYLQDRPRSVKTLADWNDYYDMWDDADIEYESSADYGEERY